VPSGIVISVILPTWSQGTGKGVAVAVAGLGVAVGTGVLVAVAVDVAEGVGVTVKVGVKVGGRGVAVNWEIRVSSAMTVFTACCVPWAATVAATDVSTAPWSIAGSVSG
ncbi:MAG TPA: hypothetical protein PLI60_03995, partial [Anaerolineaceae bacterium]|nr:hypothetical protein [Anaerolineaceae bacterium]